MSETTPLINHDTSNTTPVQQNEQQRSYNTNSTAAITFPGESGIENEPQQPQEQQQQEQTSNTTETTQQQPDESNSNEGSTPTNTASNNNSNSDFLIRTRQRLRCLFFIFTCPIIPLTVALTLLLLWVLYAAFLGDDGSQCVEPLRLYAFLSALLFLYTPHHRRIKRFLSHHERNNRLSAHHPSIDRVYDHAYLTFCLAYIYLGVAWTESCRSLSCPYGIDDGDVGSSNGTDPTCIRDCNCPHLFHVARAYVLTLCVLATVLALPLLCLPCVYLWIVRGAAADALEAAAAMASSDTWNGSGADMTQYDIEDILDKMETVTDSSHDLELGEDDSAHVKECCICMTEFQFHQPDNNDPVKRTKCGHMFHRSCLKGWLRGHWDESNATTSSRTYASRRCCPLCRKELLS